MHNLSRTHRHCEAPKGPRQSPDAAPDIRRTQPPSLPRRSPRACGAREDGMRRTLFPMEYPK